MTQPSIEVLLRSIVDYAGTFPPAQLSLAAAVSSYAHYRTGAHAWMLGRLVLPAGKLPELEELAPPVKAGAPWPVSLVLSGEAANGTEGIPSFFDTSGNRSGMAEVVAVEIPPIEPSRIGAIIDHLPGATEVFVEVPIGPKLDATVEAIAAAAASAKVRTGGVTADAFPSSSDLARFMRACREAEIGFKATAGLHHAVRGRYPLTDDPAGPKAPQVQVMMHGFLNVCVAAAVVRRGDGSSPADIVEVVEILEELSADAFRFTPEGLAWRDRTIPTADLEDTRRHFFRSFGSCDFQGPTDEVTSLRGLSD